MLTLLDLVLTIVSTLCALCLLVLGILLLLGKLPLSLSRRTRSHLRQLLNIPTSARSSPTATRPDASRTHDLQVSSQLPTQLGPVPRSVVSPLPTDFTASVPLLSTFAADGIAPPELPVAPNLTQATADQTNARLLIYLLKQLEGNVERRDRLIKYAKYRHPGQSDTWYLEKVSQDLARDHSRKSGRGTPT